MINRQRKDSPIIMLIKVGGGIWRATAKSVDTEDLVYYTRQIAEWEIPRVIDDMNVNI